MKENRKELQRVKEELWKYRGKEKKLNKVERKGENRKLREKLEMIREANERIREEKVREEERKVKWLKSLEDEKKRRNMEEIRRIKENEKKREKLEKKLKQEKSWEMAKWVHQFILKNNVRWEREKLERLEDRKRKIQEWDKHSRLEKIITKNKRKEEEEKDQDEKVDEEILMIAELGEKNWRSWKNGEDPEVRAKLEENAKHLEDDVKLKDDCTINKPKAIRLQIKLKNQTIFEKFDDDEEELIKIAEAAVDEVENEEENSPDLGLELVEKFCLDCVHAPCLCMILKAELKIEALRGAIKNEEKGKNSDKYS